MNNKKLDISESAKSEIMASTELTKAVQEIAGFRHQDHFSSLVSYMTNTLSNVVQSREHYFTELSNYRENYITNGIYDIISNDVFVDSGDLDFISIKVDKNPEVEEELNAMFKRLNVAGLLQSIIPELLHNGTYYFRPIVRDDKGIVDLIDNLEPKAVIPIADSKNQPIMFFVSNNMNNKSTVDQTGMANNQSTIQSGFTNKVSYEYYDISQIIQFSLDLGFTKLKLPDKVNKHLRTKAPDDIAKALLPSTLKLKTSQSFIWPVIDKLKEVLLLDKLSVYRDIGSILTPNLIGVPVPDVYDPEQLIGIVKKYDELLNSNVVRLNNTQNIELTLQELASVKVVPVVGDRSMPSSIEVGRSVPISSIEAVNDSIGRLLNSLGIPKELFDGVTSSVTNVKTNIRYAKKIKRIQKNLCKSLIFLCLLHIASKFPNLNIKEEDIDIQLKNNTNVDELESQEATDLMVSSVNSIKDLISGLEEIVAKSSYEIDVDAVIENIQSSFISVGSKYHNVFRKKEDSEIGDVYTNTDDIQDDKPQNTTQIDTKVKDTKGTEDEEKLNQSIDSEE